MTKIEWEKLLANPSLRTDPLPGPEAGRIWVMTSRPASREPELLECAWNNNNEQNTSSWPPYWGDSAEPMWCVDYAGAEGHKWFAVNPLAPVINADDCNRIFCEWESGSFISARHPDFQRDFNRLVAKYGPPDTVEFRARNEGWIRE